LKIKLKIRENYLNSNDEKLNKLTTNNRKEILEDFCRKKRIKIDLTSEKNLIRDEEVLSDKGKFIIFYSFIL